VVIAVFPIYWMAITAFKQDPDLYRMEHFPFWFNLAPTLRNFKILFYQTNYGSWIWNTFTISGWVALITLVTAVPAGYALARLRLRAGGRIPARHPADQPARRPDQRDLRLHALDAGLPVRAGLRVAGRPEARARRRADRADPGRHLLLGLDHGGSPARRPPG